MGPHQLLAWTDGFVSYAHFKGTKKTCLATRKAHSYHTELVRFGKELGQHNGCGRHVESVAQKPAQVYGEGMGERFSERAIIMDGGDGGAAQHKQIK
jgi:hypothetical protein